MNLFGRWKKGDGGEEATHTHNSKSNNINNKPHLIGSKHGLFGNIVGFDDVKALFEIAIKAERPVHLMWSSIIWEIIVHELTYQT